MSSTPAIESKDGVTAHEAQPVRRPVLNGSNYSFSDLDERELAKVGKKSVLRRNFAFLSILGLSCSIMITWEGLLSAFVFGLEDGGPAGLVYGFFFCWAGYTAVAASMGELVSMWPTAGGQYHWTYMLAPQEWKKILSYITGWQSIIAWQAGTASTGYLSATVIQGLVVLNYPDYVFHRWHGTLLIIAIMLVSLAVNTIFARLLPELEHAVLWLHVTGFIITLVVITVLAPVKSSPHDVFTQFLNAGGYNSKGLSFFIGLISTVFAFLGADGAVHMCEEIKHASTVVPWSMMASIILNGVLGIGMLIAILFCMGDVNAALTSPTGYPFIEIFTQATKSQAGGTALSAFIIAMFVLANIALVASASRQLWAFARDNGVPNARIIGSIEPHTKLPIVAICITATISCLLSLINIGSSTVFNAIVSLVVAGYLATYILPFSLMINMRLRHPERLDFGPWYMGRYGIFVNGFAVIWSIIVFFFSFWPSSVPVQPITMNWSCLIWGAVMIYSAAFYVFYGRKTYTGPVIEITTTEILA